MTYFDINDSMQFKFRMDGLKKFNLGSEMTHERPVSISGTAVHGSASLMENTNTSQPPVLYGTAVISEEVYDG